MTRRPSYGAIAFHKLTLASIKFKGFFCFLFINAKIDIYGFAYFAFTEEENRIVYHFESDI